MHGLIKGLYIANIFMEVNMDLQRIRIYPFFFECKQGLDSKVVRWKAPNFYMLEYLL